MLRRGKTLILLCAHRAKHMWRSLGWISDLEALLHALPDLDWAGISERAKQLRVDRAVGLGLLLANDLVDVDLPVEILAAIRRDSKTQDLGAAVKNPLFPLSPQTESVLANCSLLMRTREHAKDATRCGLERVFRPIVPESQSIALTQVLSRSYYVLRPLRLLAKRGFGEQ